MKTTFSRQLATTVAILLLALVLLGTSFRALVRNYLYDSTTKQLQDNAETVSELVASYSALNISLSDVSFRINLAVSSQVSGADIVICDASGTVVLCSEDPLGCEHVGLTLGSDYLARVFREDGDTTSGIISGLYDDLRFVAAKPVTGRSSQEPIGVVIASMPMASATAVLQQISNIFVFVSVLVVAIAAALVFILARNQCRPLREMAQVARAFGHGDLSSRVHTQGRYSQEIEDLALAFNNMATSLEKSEYRRQEFVANVSHELKTPMTTIGGYLDGMLDGTIPPEKQRYYMRLVSEEVKRLSRLVRSMLDISKLQDQECIPEERKSRFEVSECAGQVLITFEQKINDKGLQVDVQMPDHPLFTHADEDAITQVIYNLIDNAVKFCPPGGQLSLKIREGGGKIYVSVANEGETIPPDELPLVFDRFHKIDKSRSQNGDGWGLGLYIVKTIVCSHRENISVTSLDGKTEFTFTLPLVN